MNEKRRMKLSAKIGMMTVASTLGVVLFLGITFMLVFITLFSQQAEREMKDFLSNLNQRFDSFVQFIQDGAVSLRHNNHLESFFHANHFIETAAEKQLSYSFDLFSARNLTDGGSPFVKEAYLFNNKSDCIRTLYFPTTLSVGEEKEARYRSVQQTFTRTEAAYACFVGAEDGEIALCFRVLDGSMRQMGVCVAVLWEKSLQELFSIGEKYHRFSAVVTQGETLLAQQGALLTQGETLSLKDGAYRERGTLMHVLTSGFQLRSVIAIDRDNIFMVLRPTVIILILALIAALSFACAVVWALSYRMVRPFKKMSEEISAFGEESLSVRMQDFPVDEFHEISAAFNKMAERIDRRIHQVYEKKILADQAQIQFLQAQINPHFQFNILTMLAVQARQAGNEELFSYLNAYAQLFNGKIFREKEIKIPLKEEMKLVNFYLYLQKGRYQNELAYRLHYGSPEVQECLIPKLLVEPLVENAISHGLEPKPGLGRIDVNIYEEDGRLHIIVEDNGVGFQPETVLKKQKPAPGHTGTWLVNTQRLLEILYGDAYSMTVKGEANVGTRVEICLPAERSPSPVAGCHESGQIYRNEE